MDNADSPYVFSYTMDRAHDLMRRLAAMNEFALEFQSMNECEELNSGFGSEEENRIVITPFVYGSRSQRFDRPDGNGFIYLRKDCHDPVECMLAVFFHELAHLKLAGKVPFKDPEKQANGTSRFQYELWITMLGLNYARETCGLKFSDYAVKWLVEDAIEYANSKWCMFGMFLQEADSDHYRTLEVPW